MHAAFPSADRVFSFLSDAFIRKLIGIIDMLLK
jgi:hypothetical protein